MNIVFGRGYCVKIEDNAVVERHLRVYALVWEVAEYFEEAFGEFVVSGFDTYCLE